MNLEGDNLMSVKRANRAAVLRSLHEQGAMSRKRLSETLKLTPAAITKIVGELMNDGLVSEGMALPNNSVGRREILIEINRDACCAFGVMINMEEIILSAVRLDGSEICAETVVKQKDMGGDEAVALIAARLAALAEKKRIPRKKVLGIGVAVRGITDTENRFAHRSLGAIREQDYPLAAALEKATGLKTVLANNVRALFLAQLFLIGDEGRSSQFFLRCEYGIGGALSIDDKIWVGGAGRCAEIGHVPVIRRGGKSCICGKSGCLETIASPGAIREDALSIRSRERTPLLYNMTKDMAPEDIDIDLVLTAAQRGDAGVAGIVDRAVMALGSALKHLIYTVDPQKIVLYGHIFDNSYYLARLRAEMEEGIDADHGAVLIEKSPYNQKLDEQAAGILMIDYYLNHGGMME